MFKDLTGQIFGRLTVVKRVENSKSGHTRWLCLCECGNEVIVYSTNLIRGITKSCGCYNREVVSNMFKKGYGESSYNSVINYYKKRAKKHGYEFSLSEDEVKELMSSPCEYCGEEPSNKRISIANNGDFEYNGIDRVDSSKGYVKSNVVSSCGRCNYGKHTASKDEFLSCIKAIYNHLDLSSTFSSSYELSRD